MASRFADISKFRNAVFSAHQPERRYAFERPSFVGGVESFGGLDANADFIAWKSPATGSIGTALLSHPGRPTKVSDVHVALNPTCLAFSPFFASERDVLAVGGDSGALAVATLESHDDLSISASSLTTFSSGTNKRTEAICWNPIASGIIASAAGLEVAIWDVASQSAKVQLVDKDIVWNLDYSIDAQRIATSSKDGVLRIFDARKGGSAAGSVAASTGPKAWRPVWLTGLSGDLLLTTGFSKSRQRELKIWDSRNLVQPVVAKGVDTDSSVMTVVYDRDTNIIVSASRGSPIVRWYEAKSTAITDGATSYSGREVLAGLCSVPKPALDVMKCEVLRLLAPTADGMTVIPISANVPRRSYLDFQAELFPDTRNGNPAVTAEEFWEGTMKPVPLMSLDPRTRPAVLAVTAAPFSVPTLIQPAVAAPAIAEKANGATVNGSSAAANNAQPAAPVSAPAPALSLASFLHPPVEAMNNLSIGPVTPAARSRSVTPASRSPSSTRSTSPNPLPPVNSSSFRFVQGTGHVKFDNFKSLSIVIPNECDAIAANDCIIAAPLQGPGGRIGIIYTDNASKTNVPTRLPAQIPCLLNGTDVYDFQVDPFNPFDPARIVAACDDGKLRVWKVLRAMESDRDAASVDAVIAAHASRANVVRFHPRAKDVLLSCSNDLKVKVWDLSSTEKPLLEFDVPSPTLAAAWSTDGKQIAIAGRDKKLRVFDARTGTKLHEWDSHEGIKGVRLVWLGDSGRIASVGFGKASMREITVYSPDGHPKVTKMTINPSIVSVHYDEDLKLLFLGGRGDRNVSIYAVNEDNSATSLTQYESGHVQQGFSFFPKTAMDVMGVEIARCWRLNSGNIEKVSFTLPRTRTECFQDPVFPPTRVVTKPVESAAAWFAGQDGEVVRVSLKPAGERSLSDADIQGPVSTTEAAPESQRSQIGRDPEKAFVNTLLSAARGHEDDNDEVSWEEKKEGVDPDEWD